MVYYYALYPVSLCTFLTVVCLLLFIRRRYWQAGIVGALCTWAFATGPLLIVVLFLAACSSNGAAAVAGGPAVRRRGARGVCRTPPGVPGPGRELEVYLLTQTKYANGLHDPIATFVTAFTGTAPADHVPLLTPNRATAT